MANKPVKERLRRIEPDERKRIVSNLAQRLQNKRARVADIVVVGDGGVASNEIGETTGVCAEAPLPRTVIRAVDDWLDGACGIAVTLGLWRAKVSVYCPSGSGKISLLQKKLLEKRRIRHRALSTGAAQGLRHIRRVFAAGHQLAHLEHEEHIATAGISKTRKTLTAIKKELRSAGLLCIVDRGCFGIDKTFLPDLCSAARHNNVCILYEAKTLYPLTKTPKDLLKINHNQIRQWLGVSVESDADALKAAKEVGNQSGAERVVFTRGEQGIVVSGVDPTEDFVVLPEPKKLFDLVSAGDMVAAGLAFCLGRRTTLLEAVCFAASAAEISLDQRYRKQFDLSFIFDRDAMKT